MMMTNKFLIPGLLALLLTACSEEQEPKKFNDWSLSAENTSWFEVLTFKTSHHDLTKLQSQSLKTLIAQTDDDLPLYARIQINASKYTVDQATLLRTKAIKKLLQIYGIKGHRIDVIYASPAELAAQLDENKHKIMVVIDQYKLNLPDCTKKPTLDMRQDDLEATLGCATIRNQAIMIAEPRDVYRAQSKAPTDATRQNLAVDYYRTDKVKAVVVEKASSSK